jgi:hypothetical protein
MGSDMDKKNLLIHFIEQGTISEESFDKLLPAIGHLGSDNDKMDLFTKLIDGNSKTEDQWISLINATAQIGADNGKSDLLQRIAKKMLSTEKIKTAYMKMARTINDDAGYGRAVRAVE